MNNDDEDLMSKLFSKDMFNDLKGKMDKPITMDSLKELMDAVEPADTFYIQPSHMPLMPVVPGVTEHTGSFPAKQMNVSIGGTPLRDIQHIQVNERYGMGLINGSGVAVAKNIKTGRWEPPDDDVNEVLLLPRKMGSIEFTDEQLTELMHESKAQVFDVDRLIWKVGNTQIPERHHGKEGMPTKLWLEPAGLFANLRVKHRPSIQMGHATPEAMQRQFGIEGVVVAGNYEAVPKPEAMWTNTETAIHISDEMIQNSQWDVMGELLRTAGQQMARVKEQEIFAAITKPGEINQNGRVYTEQTLNRAMLANDTDIGSGSDQ